MNKLYWIVCDDKDNNVFEGRYQGRTRGEALKFLKQSVGRKSLNGLVFTITEIPVSLIREIFSEMLAGSNGTTVANAPSAANVVPITQPRPEPKVERFDAFADGLEVPAAPAQPDPPRYSRKGSKINLGHGTAFWSEVRAYYATCRSPQQTSDRFGLSPNSIKTRARREGWNK
jgi:hypothetical protein